MADYFSEYSSQIYRGISEKCSPINSSFSYSFCHWRLSDDCGVFCRIGEAAKTYITKSRKKQLTKLLYSQCPGSYIGHQLSLYIP